MDCHAKWPDTRGQRGLPGRVSGEGAGVIVGGEVGASLWGGGREHYELDVLPSQFIPY